MPLGEATMIQIAVNDDLGAKLRETGERAELCDPTGKILGLFLPLQVYDNLVRPEDNCPFAPDELAQLHQQTEGRSLSDILKDLQAT
jgi:hypothetical protein